MSTSLTFKNFRFRTVIEVIIGGHENREVKDDKVADLEIPRWNNWVYSQLRDWCIDGIAHGCGIWIQGFFVYAGFIR